MGCVEKTDLHSEWWRGNVTVVHQDSSDKYTTVATVDTFAGAKTIAVDPKTPANKDDHHPDLEESARAA
jgi:hypothetical protein